MKKTVQKSRVAATLVWFFYAVTVVLLSVLISWALYSQANYGYGFWYQQLDIDTHIQKYGPKNRFRYGFEQLPSEQHIQAFEQIRDAVHQQGEGLADIHYTLPGRKPVPLLHEAEIRHLQDVADLIDVGRWLMVALAPLWVLLSLLCIRLAIPPMRQRILITVFALGAMIAWLAIVGPTQIFYQFHVWLFPAENQWFFYWQDSPVVGKRVDQHRGVLTSLHNFIEVKDCAGFDCAGHRAVDPACAVGIEQIPSNKVAGGEIFVTRHRDQRFG